jgi:NADH:ubiquinone oxidoreductase subunit F (NADH-binding)
MTPMTTAVDTSTERLLGGRSHGLLPWPDPAALLAAVERSGLTGRGGAGFPTVRKMAAIIATGRAPVVVANAAEGEPASAKDRALLQRAPHLVLDGLRLAAHAVGATTMYLYGSHDVSRPQDISFVRAEATFLAGEESAVVSAIERRAARPRDTPRRVIEAGVGGAPTLVHNVETLAHLALIARYGPDWFRELGTPDEPGTFLATVSGPRVAGGVFEVPYGEPLGTLLNRAGVPRTPPAVLVGGFHGAWVPGDPRLELSRAALRPYGASPGAGVIVVLEAGQCGLAASANVARYLAGQSAGQCGPCLNGLPRMADVLTQLARPPQRASGPDAAALAAEVRRLTTVVDGRGACRHPDGTARFVRSSLHMFADEVDRHRAGHCIAGRRS